MRVNHDTHVGPSFSVGNRLARVIWGIVRALLFKPSPRPVHIWRVFLLRCFGAKIGSGVHVYPGVVIWAPWNLEIADGVGIASGSILYSQGKITIGRQSVISQGAHLCAGTHNYNQEGFPLMIKPIVIGDHVWIAAEAFVHPGVTIGEGTVVGARSVVTKDLPAWKVCSGFPATVIKDRVMEG
jgi:putative colanic acid biosynthesis acetyltransferase WcaF